MTAAAAASYPLGHTAAEHQRLIRQARLFAPFTARFLRDAGIATGMRVLDIGCGLGDVSMIVAELVGTSGSVTGLDRNAAALSKACERAASAGHENITFVQADVEELAKGEPFDAAVGRLILMFLPNLAVALKSLRNSVRPGGILAFQEASWDSTLKQTAHLPVRMAVASLVHAAFQKGEARTNMELELYRGFQDAGLPPPTMRNEMLIGGDSETRRWLPDLLLSLWPKVTEHNLPHKEIGDLATLPDRLEEELDAANSFAACVGLVGAFARRPVS